MSSLSGTDPPIPLIEQSYPVGAVKSLTPINYPQIGVVTGEEEINVWRVETGLGAFCLKRHRPSKSLARAVFEEQFQGVIYEAAAHLVAAPLSTNNGSSGVTSGSNRFRMERLIPSSHYIWWRGGWGTNVCYAAGRGLFDFHEAAMAGLHSQTLKSCCTGSQEAQRFLVEAPHEKIYESCIGSLDGVKRKISQSDLGNVHCEWKPCIDEYETLLFHSQQAIGSLPPTAAQDCRIVHGDYHPGNTLLAQDRLAAIVDFEDVRVESWLYDLAYALIMFCTRWQAEEDDRNSTDNEARAAFLNGYLEGTHYALNREGELSTYTLIACALISGWLLERFALFAGADVTFHDKDLLKCLKRIQRVWDTALS